MSMKKATKTVKPFNRKEEADRIGYDLKTIYEAFLSHGFTTDQSFQLLLQYVKITWKV